VLDISWCYFLIVGQWNLLYKRVTKYVGNLRVEGLLEIILCRIYSGQNCALKIVYL